MTAGFRREAKFGFRAARAGRSMGVDALPELLQLLRRTLRDGGPRP